MTAASLDGLRFFMETIALTGGVGMGKSAAADLLRGRGVPVVDTDDLARKVVEPGQPALKEIQGVFGGDMIGVDGQLCRDKLAGVVFADSGARAKLEAILHPRIRELWRQQVAAWRGEGKPLAVVVIPLLFETGAEAEFQTVICLACAAATQRQRLLARGWSAEEIARRNAAQLPIGQKMARAHHVVWTEAGMDVHAQQLFRIIPVE